MLARHEGLQQAWNKMLAGDAKLASLGADEVAKIWMPVRAEVISSL